MRSIIMDPCSSNSCLLIHICWKEPKELRIEPPTHGENFLSVLLMTLTFTFCGEISGIWRWSLSKKPLKRVLPPERITFWKRSRLMSMSDLLIDSTAIEWMPVKPLWFSVYKHQLNKVYLGEHFLSEANALTLEGDGLAVRQFILDAPDSLQVPFVY